MRGGLLRAWSSHATVANTQARLFTGIPRPWSVTPPASLADFYDRARGGRSERASRESTKHSKV